MGREAELHAAEDHTINKALWLHRLCQTIATETGGTREHALQLIHATGDLPRLLRIHSLQPVRPPDTPLDSEAVSPRFAWPV
jgi:hypothetical protein